MIGALVGGTVGRAILSRGVSRAAVGRIAENQFAGKVAKVTGSKAVQGIGGKYAPNLTQAVTADPGAVIRTAGSALAPAIGTIAGAHIGNAVQSGGRRATNFAIGSGSGFNQQSDTSGGMY